MHKYMQSTCNYENQKTLSQTGYHDIYCMDLHA